jgi:hypothetical protein
MFRKPIFTIPTSPLCRCSTTPKQGLVGRSHHHGSSILSSARQPRLRGCVQVIFNPKNGIGWNDWYPPLFQLRHEPHHIFFIADLFSLAEEVSTISFQELAVMSDSTPR